MVIERDRIYTENANLSHGFGYLELATFAPFPKNPAISKVLREIGPADELGSGMRNTYKYTQLYSGGEPKFVEGDVFRTSIPLCNANSTVTVGPTTQVTTTVTTQVTTQDKDKRLEALIEFGNIPRSKKEMMEHVALTNTNHFRKAYLKPLLDSGKLVMTIPDKPNSRNRKYVNICASVKFRTFCSLIFLSSQADASELWRLSSVTIWLWQKNWYPGNSGTWSIR